MGLEMEKGMGRTKLKAIERVKDLARAKDLEKESEMATGTLKVIATG